jgi:dTDP-4-dehydrorhamnose reductase
VRQLYAKDRPQVIIHCAAIAKTAACQQNPSLARMINVEVTEFLANLASDSSFIFFSTDLVFDGRKGNYVESDPVNPLNVYAQTKVAAEEIVLRNPRHTILRTSLNYGFSPTGDRSFNEEIERAWRAGQTLNLFTDEFRCPISAEITARAVLFLMARKESGLYHLAGRERLSRWQIGQLLAARHPLLHPRMESSSLRDYTGPPRSPDTSLCCARLQKLLPFDLAGLSEWLASRTLDSCSDDN